MSFTSSEDSDPESDATIDTDGTEGTDGSFEDVRPQRKGIHHNNPCIPCIYIKSSIPSKYVMVFYHANAADLGLCMSFGRTLSSHLDVHVLMVEYPGYGIYEGVANEKQILDDSLIVYEYLVNVVNVDP